MPPITYKYGLVSSNKLNDLEVELACWNKGIGKGPYFHFRNAAKMLYPKRIWHSWSEWRLPYLASRSYNSWTGCASCGKTDDALFFAFLWWLKMPCDSAVILTSTTGKMIRKRGWPVIQKMVEDWPGPFPFNMVDSKMTLQFKKGDDKHSISAIAVAEGSLSDAVANIQGHHAERVFVIVDEAEATPEAIYSACSNLMAGTKEYKFLEMANPESKFTVFGRNIEPTKGWSSITVEDEEWETKWGICLHFDGEKSPNVIAGETKYSFLPTQAYLDALARREGGRDTVGYYKFGRGFVAPEGICTGIISENALIRGGAFGKHIFISEKTKIAGLDPAFTSGGDKCKLQFGEMGDLADGSVGINLLREVIIPISPTDPLPARYQVMERVKKECKDEGVLPYCFGLDDTAGGVGDIFRKEWNPNIKRIMFGGEATDEQVSLDDARTGKEAYQNRVTQLWFNVANFVDAGQLKGLKSDAAYIKQFTSRKFEFKGRKKQIEPKKDYKERSGESPDDADAVAVLVEVARQLGARAGAARAVEIDQDWDKACRQASTNYTGAEFNQYLASYDGYSP